jgi:hypothetical protein
LRRSETELGRNCRDVEKRGRNWEKVLNMKRREKEIWKLLESCAEWRKLLGSNCRVAKKGGSYLEVIAELRRREEAT